MNIGHCLTVRIQDESCEVPQAADKTLTQRLLCLSPARKPVNGPRTIDDAKILFFSFLHSRFLINFYAIVIPFGHLPYRNGSMNPLTGIVPFLCDCHPCVIPPAPSSLQNLSVHCNIVSVACLRHAVPRTVPHPTLRLSPCVGLLRWPASGTRAVGGLRRYAMQLRPRRR